MKIEKKKVNVNSGCESETKVDDEKVTSADTCESGNCESGTECAEDAKEVEGVEDINDVGTEPEDDVEAKKNLGLAKQFYSLAANHVQNAIDALGDAASNGDKYAKQEIADLSVILMDIKNLERMG